MKVLIPGHLYELENFENKDVTGQQLQFIHKETLDGSSQIISDGTTNEELLEVLINRANFQNAKFPCRENAIAVTHLDTALLWFQKRTADRIKRNVEGKHVA
jgi:hypothetical protein